MPHLESVNPLVAPIIVQQEPTWYLPLGQLDQFLVKVKGLQIS